MGNIVSSYNAGLVGYANSEEIAELLLEVCGMPEDALLKMGQNGKRWVTENLSWSKVADQYLQMYNDYYAGI